MQVSYSTRALAEQLGVNLSEVVASARWGISKQDVERHAQAIRITPLNAPTTWSSTLTSATSPTRREGVTARHKQQAHVEATVEAAQSVKASTDPLLLDATMKLDTFGQKKRNEH
ncbi:hypothetical protein CYMTET_15259 [Cymbomonas tetramitiformis]|uniref:Uncharacterized protein n=1 Tax=Cymbomonas tetramitiformis TaxID=36881 RepID=A0AAE0GEE3_9CHLO|nr:hypothetical protein CYMTET_15259 [Cymbomonas tetramitiformis]